MKIKKRSLAVGTLFSLNQESLLAIFKNLIEVVLIRVENLSMLPTFFNLKALIIAPVEFNKLHYRDRSLIRNHAGFEKSDEMVFNG